MDTQQLAITALEAGDLTCAVALDGRVVFTSTARGVKPLVDFYREHGDAYRGAALADKVIGRAAVLLASLCGVASVHARVMSRPAWEELGIRGMTGSYGTLVEAIRNRDDTGLCPMESLSQGVEDPTEMLEKVEAFFAGLG